MADSSELLRVLHSWSEFIILRLRPCVETGDYWAVTFRFGLPLGEGINIIARKNPCTWIRRFDSLPKTGYSEKIKWITAIAVEGPRVVILRAGVWLYRVTVRLKPRHGGYSSVQVRLSWRNLQSTPFCLHQSLFVILDWLQAVTCLDHCFNRPNFVQISIVSLLKLSLKK